MNARRYNSERLRLLVAFAELANERLLFEEEMREKLGDEKFAAWKQEQEEAAWLSLLESIKAERAARATPAPQACGAGRHRLRLLNRLGDQTSRLKHALGKFAARAKESFQVLLLTHARKRSSDGYMNVHPLPSEKHSD